MLYKYYSNPGVNFTNILWAAFMRADPKSAKKTVKQLFALLGSVHLKAACENIDEIDP